MGLGFYFLYDGKSYHGIAFLLISLAFSITTFFKPDLLYPLNKIWMRLGWLLGKIFSPIILGTLYFGMFTPIAILMKIIGRDHLKIKELPSQSHWKDSSPVSSETRNFENQF